MNLIRRKVWGARPPRSVSFIKTPTAKLILHHFATNSWTGPAGMRACQNFHMDDRGYHDIAYSMMVDAGAVYEGRGPGVQGAHTEGWNDEHAVAAAIDGTSYVPDGVLDRLAEAAVWLWREGAVVAPAYTDGHRDLGSSSCPGEQLYRLIPEINRRAQKLAERGDVVSYEQAVVVPDDRWDRALGTAIAAWHTLALVEADDDGQLTSGGKKAEVGEPILVGAAQKLDLPNAHVVAGGTAKETALAVAQFLVDHPTRRIPGQRLTV